MGAGVPNYQRLAELGKLPASMRDKIPGLAALDAIQEKLDKILGVLCETCKEKADAVLNGKKVEPKEPEGGAKILCPVLQCEYTAEGRTEGIARNTLRLHQQGKHPELVGEKKE